MSGPLGIAAPVIDKRSLDRNVDVTFRQRTPDDAALVVSSSPLSLRKRVETLARYFRRVFGYDFINYQAAHCPPDCEAWLWTTPGGDGRLYATGHAVFWRQDFEDRPEPEWELGSVWQHPYERRQGRLTEVWPYWQDRYGPFWVSTPLSSAMRDFLSRAAGHLPNGTALSEWVAS